MAAENENAEDILNNYKRMMAECQQIATKISEVTILNLCCFWFVSLSHSLTFDFDLNSTAYYYIF